MGEKKNAVFQGVRSYLGHESILVIQPEKSNHTSYGRQVDSKWMPNAV